MVKAAGLAFGSVGERERERVSEGDIERDIAKQNAHTLALLSLQISTWLRRQAALSDAR